MIDIAACGRQLRRHLNLCLLQPVEGAEALGNRSDLVLEGIEALEALNGRIDLHFEAADLRVQGLQCLTGALSSALLRA